MAPKFTDAFSLQSVLDVTYTNNVHPGDVVSAVTYVKSLDENISGDMESLVVTTVGVKGMDSEDLAKLSFPVELLEPGMTGRQMEAICEEKVPELKGKIVVSAERRIIRQASRSEAFLL